MSLVHLLATASSTVIVSVPLWYFVGQCYSKTCQDDLNSELIDHQDLVQGNFIDTYHNNTIKFRVGLRYMAYHCKSSKYVLIIDGDYSLNVPR